MPRFCTKGRGCTVHAMSEKFEERLGLDLFECNVDGKIVPRDYDPVPMVKVGENVVPELPPEPTDEEAAEMAGSKQSKKKKKS